MTVPTFSTPLNHPGRLHTALTYWLVLYSAQFLVVRNCVINFRTDGICRKAKTGQSFRFHSPVLMVCTFDRFTYFQNVDLNWRLFVWYCTGSWLAEIGLDVLKY